ncbi:MAG: AmmeMemoRadiSam system radical SAM enzyme [Actinobacteria bacterium]|nr:AmmeMemoRadiSam system radical SAM enzyme [Actinomycetota bacterium]
MDPEPAWSIVPTKFWHALDDGRIQCDLCPRECKLREGQRGLCFTRARREDEIVLTSYGRSTGFWVDPIEKKPLNHFLPGTSVLSFGTAGCNLACRYCQNWDISKARGDDILAQRLSPQGIADTAKRLDCAGVAFTYNDPVIFHEYAVDTADAAHRAGLKAVAVTAGYVNPQARAEFFEAMDAANVDLKAFTDEFYHRYCAGRLQPVLDTLAYIRHETDVWLEITTLLIPGLNDSEEEIDEMTRWIADTLGPDVPHHFTAFHPAFKMLDVPQTRFSTLERAREIAMGNGLWYVYTGNIPDEVTQSTWCPTCGAKLIGRSGYSITAWNIDRGCCGSCGTVVSGVFEDRPGSWGPIRHPVVL